MNIHAFRYEKGTHEIYMGARWVHDCGCDSCRCSLWQEMPAFPEKRWISLTGFMNKSCQENCSVSGNIGPGKMSSTENAISSLPEQILIRQSSLNTMRRRLLILVRAKPVVSLSVYTLPLSLLSKRASFSPSMGCPLLPTDRRTYFLPFFSKAEALMEKRLSERSLTIPCTK